MIHSLLPRLPLMILCCAALFAATAGVGAPGAASGWLEESWRCGPSGCERAVYLADGRGRIEVALPPGLLPPHASRTMVGQPVEVRGSRSLSSLRVTSLRALSAPQAVASATGAQPYVTLLVRFAGQTATPLGPNEVSALMGSAPPGLDHFYRETSLGQMNLAGSRVVGWYNLPKPLSAYKKNGRFDEFSVVPDAIAAADRDVDFRKFAGINLLFNAAPRADASGIGGRTRLTVDGASKVYGVTWAWPQAHGGHLDQSAWAHELGHSFGWPHSSGPYAETYDSRWDYMSYSFAQWGPPFGYTAGGTIAWNKTTAGWIPASRRYTAARGSERTIHLERLVQPSAQGYLVAEIPVAGTGQFYTVEARQRVGYDEVLPAEGVIIHKVDPRRDDRSAQVADGTRNGDTNDAGAVWTPGETFTDAANKIRVTVEEAAGSGYLVTVVNGGAPAREPDLTGAWTGVKVTRRKRGRRITYMVQGSVRVANGGEAAAGASMLRVFLSTDRVWDPEDAPVAMDAACPALRPGERRTLSLPTLRVKRKAYASYRGRYLVGVADAGRVVAEGDEENNTFPSAVLP